MIAQIDRSLETGLYFLSLFGALTVPDIAGALEAPDGQSSGARYKDWYERWVRPRFQESVQKLLAEHGVSNFPSIENPLSGDTCYRFRCYPTGLAPYITGVPIVG